MPPATDTAGFRLSRTIRHAADRVGGAEVLIIWPHRWPIPDGAEAMSEDEEMDTSDAEHRALSILLGDRGHLSWRGQPRGLVPVRSAVVRHRRHTSLHHAPGETVVHLAVHLIGSRWVHADWQGTPPVRVVDAPAPDWPMVR